ncbi:MAG: bifunctional nicotinamidase/pyrazinamidase [Nitrospiria bacterium]
MSQKDTGLIIVDLQNDFCPGGALAVSEGDCIVPVINDYIARFQWASAPIFATRDWHPPKHISFNTQGGPWPPHCVQETKGAAFHPGLQLPKSAQVVSKGQDPDQDAYSGFQGTDLADRLRKRGIRRVFVCGLATDYCVKATVLDAVKEGFVVALLEDAIRGVNIDPKDSEKAIGGMKAAGATLVRFNEVGGFNL